MKNTTNQKGEIGILGWIGVIVLIFIIGGALVFFTETLTAPSGPTVADVVKNPENYYGQQLSLKGEIENMKTPHIFTLDQEGTATGDEMLVLSLPAVEPQGGSGNSSASANLNDQDVLVNGTVRRFVSADINKETGWDLDPQVVIDFENKPVIIARDVELLPER